LLELRGTACDFKWSYLIGAILLGVLIGMFAGALWSVLGSLVARRLGGKGKSSQLRLVWGAASVPGAASLLILFPLDLLLVGTDAFRAVGSEQTGNMVWRGLSVAFSAALLVWSLWLLFRGAEAVTKLRASRAGWLVALAVFCLALPVVPLVIAGSGGSPCPT
jgi:hypothetical protein